MDMEKIGRFIKELRIKKGISQNQLSEEIHITRQAISKWETGKSIPESEMLKVLSKYFQVTVDDILSGEKVQDKNHLEETTLNLVDETNKKQNKIKRLRISFITSILFFLFLFLVYYFITNYNSITVYTITGIGEDCIIREGITISTKGKSYIRIGEPNFKNRENPDIESMELLWKDKKEVRLYKKKSLDNIVLKYSYKNKKQQKNMIQNLYLKINYKDKNSEVIKLNAEEDFKNGLLGNTRNEEKTSLLKTTEEVSQEQYEPEEILEREEEEPSFDLPISNPLEEESTPEEKRLEEALTSDSIIEEKPINYEEIISFIEDNGIEQFGRKGIEFQEENTIISIASASLFLYIDILCENTIESIEIDTQSKNVIYQKYENYIEIENRKTNLEDTEIKEIIDRYLHLFQEKIMESNGELLPEEE